MGMLVTVVITNDITRYNQFIQQKKTVSIIEWNEQAYFLFLISFMLALLLEKKKFTSRKLLINL